MSELGIGDPVETKSLRLVSLIPYVVEDEWVPATVVSVKEHAIGVAYADGTRRFWPARYVRRVRTAGSTVWDG